MEGLHDLPRAFFSPGEHPQLSQPVPRVLGEHLGKKEGNHNPTAIPPVTGWIQHLSRVTPAAGLRSGFSRSWRHWGSQVGMDTEQEERLSQLRRLNQFPGTYSNANEESTRGSLDPLALKPLRGALAMQMQRFNKGGTSFPAWLQETGTHLSITCFQNSHCSGPQLLQDLGTALSTLLGVSTGPP